MVLQQLSERRFPTAIPHQNENRKRNLLLIKTRKFFFFWIFTLALVEAAVFRLYYVLHHCCDLGHEDRFQLRCSGH